MTRVALLSNPRSTGNQSLLPQVRSFCAAHKDIFHYEVERADQIDEALKTIARVKPRILVINGGDGTVQAALTELHQGGHFGADVPPVAVLPNGKTNLIALDLGAHDDPIASLKRVMQIAEQPDLAPYIVSRELISLTDGTLRARPVLGMFLGGAGLADTMLFCRYKVYPLGLPNGVSHVLTAFAVILTILFGVKAAFLPPRPSPVKVSVLRQGQLQGRFSLLMVTTLERLLLNMDMHSVRTPAGALKLMVIEQSPKVLLRVILAAIRGRLGRSKVSGVHVERGDEIRIEGDQSSVILDGELFKASRDHPIVLTHTPPVPFLRLAA
jgi:hypothetical protein